MQNSISISLLLLFLLCDATADSWNSVNGCYSTDNNSTKFNFYCSNAEKSFNETCVNTTLSEAMQKLNSSGVTELKMCGCAIDTLVNVMKKLGNVRVLDISNSHYGSDGLFAESAVDVLFNRKLVKLNVAHNNLTKIPDELFNKMPNLTVIDLSHNQLKLINSTTFKGATELVEIHLQQNGIRHFEEGTFADAKVEYLDLRDNYISRNYYENFGLIDCNILSLLNHPIVIYVSWQYIGALYIDCIKTELKVRFDEYESIRFRNGIVELHCNQFSYRNLLLIGADSNQMKNVHEIISIVGLTLESFYYLNVSGSDLMEFDFSILSKMKRLWTLDISNCNLKKVINPSVLQFIGIQFFYANGNQIRNAHEIIEHLNPAIRWLHLSGSSIGKLHSTAIIKMQNLENLDLSNTDLQMVDQHYAFGQFINLEFIDFSMNNMNKIIFTMTFPLKLKRLNVSGCQIENVLDVIQLQGTEVEILDLSGNFVGTLNNTSFDQLNRLEYLILRNTSLSFSDSNPFYKLKNLTKLIDISNNNLKHFNFTMLSLTLSKLSWFTAADCNIENVLDVIKLLGPYIQLLDLSENILGKLNTSTFDKLTELWALNLRNTSLSIKDGSNPFEQMVLLLVLDISHNNLSNVNWTIFSSTLGRLTKLSVAGCQISNVLDLIELLGSHIEELDLSGNHVGEINVSTFARFKLLQVLHLSNTTLLNFDFNIVEHAKDLNLLDISYNRFTKLNVSLKFDNLQTLDLCGCELTEIHNFDKFLLPKLRLLGISENRLSCEALEQLKNEWPRLEFTKNNQSQKNQQICQKPIDIETTTDISTEVLKPFKFKVTHILSMILSVIFLIAIFYILFRYILCEKRCDNGTRNDDTELIVAHREVNEIEGEHIYEEIVERIDPYDHLNFDPPPSSAVQQHYENAPEPSNDSEIISIASQSSESYDEIDN